MHIPDNYLSPQTCAVMTAVMVPVWAVSIRRVKREIPKEKIPMLGVGAAFSFLGMMFNVPLPGGTTGHAVGGTLLSALLGPYAACISITAALLLQALLFGDGGILSFGANCFNMAFVMPFVGYAVMKAMERLLSHGSKEKTSGRRLLSLGIGSYVGINAAALCAAIEFGIQPMLFRDASGNALYCPYDLRISIPAMMIGHLTVFGLAEVAYSLAVYAFLEKTPAAGLMQDSGLTRGKAERKEKQLDPQQNGIGVPDAISKPEVSAESRKSGRGIAALLTALIVLTPLGLLAEGTAWGEWGTDEIAAQGAGYTPAGMLQGFDWSALLPDYSVAGLPGWFGYILSAVIGVSLIIIMFKLIGGRESKAA